VEPNGNYYFLEVNPRIQVPSSVRSTLGSVISLCRLCHKWCECTSKQEQRMVVPCAVALQHGRNAR